MRSDRTDGVITVVLVDDSREVRVLLRRFIERDGRLEVTGEAEIDARQSRSSAGYSRTP
jgi:hypothetical protein